ncbi:MAG: hypothetical protein NZ772_10550 [Cyanobacteria bacterium]|nr:hypothetical protein [Cyanobacteriota bacterium]MDW8201914.1 hypothetical protein [Cyanobacteriota bacterium SKYGB_h_bin112]
MAPTDCFPYTMAELFAHATSSGVLTLTDRYTMKAAVLQENLPDEERKVIDRLLYGVRKGRLRLVDSY